MISQVLILRELLVLAQGQELKLALGLWGWLLWVGVGSLAGGRFRPGPPGPGPGWAGCWRSWGCCCLPPSWRAGPPPAWRASPGPIPAAVHHLPALCAPAGPLRVGFRLLFPQRGPGPVSCGSPKSRGRAYYLETLGAALGVALLQLFLVGRYANLSLGLAVGLGLALAPWLLARPRSRAARAALSP